MAMKQSCRLLFLLMLVHGSVGAGQEVTLSSLVRGRAVASGATAEYVVNRRVEYAVRGDGRTLARGTSGIWILGAVLVEVSLKGVTNLELEVRTGDTRPSTLFWADPQVITEEGKVIPLAALAISMEGAAQPTAPGQDFEGGPIKVAGVAYTNALSAQPKEGQKPALLRVDLSSVKAARIRAVLGGD